MIKEGHLICSAISDISSAVFLRDVFDDKQNVSRVAGKYGIRVTIVNRAGAATRCGTVDQAESPPYSCRM